MKHNVKDHALEIKNDVSNPGVKKFFPKKERKLIFKQSNRNFATKTLQEYNIIMHKENGGQLTLFVCLNMRKVTQ